MFLRGPVPIHLKSVVAYCKTLGKCQIVLAQSMAGSLVGLEGSGCTQGMSTVKMWRPLHDLFKCPAMHRSYSLRLLFSLNRELPGASSVSRCTGSPGKGIYLWCGDVVVNVYDSLQCNLCLRYNPDLPIKWWRSSLQHCRGIFGSL